MLFNSFAFLVFFPLVTAGYFALPFRCRWAWLLAASCVFYMWFIPVYVLILGFTVGVDYLAGLLIENAEGSRRRWLLGISIAANVGVLAVFKYCNFCNDNLAALAQVIGWNYPIENLALVLPIGLSFHTFQAMSYTIEVYRGAQRAERHLGIYALYVMFYPQLVAGPIERPQNLLHQFHAPHTFDYVRVCSGLRLMALGLFMKVVVADRLALIVNPVYAEPAQYSGPFLLLATVCFAFQILYDFAGYSTVAIGAARVMGFTLMRNFDRPYSATSIADFWRRWHISLSTWFKDYLYVPLGGNRVSTPARYRNLFVVFLISGLWHGASWTFVIWGALHGFYLVFGLATQGIRNRVTAALGLERRPGCQSAFQVLTVFALVSLGWIFFRAATVADAWYIVAHLGIGWESVLSGAGVAEAWQALGVKPLHCALAVLGILAVETVQLLRVRLDLAAFLSARPVWLRWGFYYAVATAIFGLGLFGQEQFIYFQF